MPLREAYWVPFYSFVRFLFFFLLEGGGWGASLEKENKRLLEGEKWKGKTLARLANAEKDPW